MTRAFQESRNGLDHLPIEGSWPRQGNSANGMTRSLCVTTSWDDGHPLDLRLADLLAKYGFRGTFYVPRKSPHTAMSEKQISQLSPSFEIGAHTLDHVYLRRVSDSEAHAQISGSRRWIEDVTGRSCGIFCFPGGEYRSRHLSLVRAAGFFAARTTELLSIQRPRRKADLLLIPTTVQAFPHAPVAYARNVLKRGSPRSLLRFGSLFYSHDWVALAKRLFFRAMEQRGVFHLWGHSWEIERQAQWRQLEELLAVIAEHRPALRFVTNGQLCAGNVPFQSPLFSARQKFVERA